MARPPISAAEAAALMANDGDFCCDFCSSRDISWDYPARDFSMPTGDVEWGSRGGWAACNECHLLIEAKDREGLARRSAVTFVQRAQRDPTVSRAVKRMKARSHMAHFRDLHGRFWDARTGPGRPVGPHVPLGPVTLPDGAHGRS